MLRNNFVEGHLRNILQSYYFILEYQKQVSKFFSLQIVNYQIEND
jgi:hypothetical protein